MVRELSRNETRKRVKRSDEIAIRRRRRRARFFFFFFFSQPLSFLFSSPRQQDDAFSSGPFPRAAAALARARASVSAPCSPCKPHAAFRAAAAAPLRGSENERTDGRSSGGGGLLGPSAPLAAAELATGRAKASVALEEQGLAATALKKELEAALGGLRAELAEAREARRRRRRGEGLAVSGAVSSISPLVSSSSAAAAAADVRQR